MLKLPHVTVSVDFENGDDNSGHLGMEALGYGIHQAWIYLAMFSTVDIFQLQAVATGVYGTSTSVTLPASLLVFAVCLLLFGTFHERLTKLFAIGKTMVAGAVLTSLGTIILAFAGGGTLTGLACEVIAGVATGLGTAILIVYWGIIFSSMNLSSIVFNSTIAIILAFIIFVAIYIALPAEFSAYLTALLPLLEIPVLYKRTPSHMASFAKVPYFRSLPIQKHAFAMLFLPSVLLFGLALGVFRQVSVQNVVTLAAMHDGSMSFVLACAAALLAMFLILSSAKMGTDWKDFFRPLLPVMLIAAICLPYATQSETLLAPCVLLIGYLFFEMFMWIYFSTLAESYRLSPIMVFGLGRGCLALAALISFFAFSWITSMFTASAYGATGTVVIMLLIIFFAYLALPSNDKIKPLANMKSTEDGCEDRLFEASIVNVNETLQAIEVVDEPSEQSVEDAEEAPIAKAGAESPQAEEKATSASTKGKVSLTNAHDGGDITLSSDEHLANECEAVANTFLLSRREAEVCFLLARGHNSSYIQEKLFISEGTAKTHTRHIYRKLDIHSQEELIRLVESYSELV